ncbi:MAG TPA: hypothetical protein VI408_10670 [Gaiellaceae bacterium]
MPRAVEHYKRLGFEISNYDDGYAFAQRQGVNLHYWHRDEVQVALPSWQRLSLLEPATSPRRD